MSQPVSPEQDAIARRAYEIWEAEGHPHGRDREHWEQACQELGTPVPMPADFKDGVLPEAAPESEPEATPKKKAAPRRTKAAAVPADPEASATEAAPKPVRRRKTAPPAE